MMVVGATRIERGVAVGADGIGVEVGVDGELGVAVAAEDGFVVPLGLGPGCQRMIRQGVVAVFAGVVGGAAFCFDGDDVEG